MIKRVLFVILLFLTFTIYGQANAQMQRAKPNSFPTNLDGGNFNNLKVFNGKVVAYDGIIEKIENSRNNTPFYKLKIDNNGDYLWTILMFENPASKVGDTIRVVGYLRPVFPKNQLRKREKKFLDGEYMVIAFGLIDFRNSNYLFVHSAYKQKQEWFDGQIPNGG